MLLWMKKFCVVVKAWLWPFFGSDDAIISTIYAGVAARGGFKQLRRSEFFKMSEMTFNDIESGNGIPK